jgi:acetyl esterase/lipase
VSVSDTPGIRPATTEPARRGTESAAPAGPTAPAAGPTAPASAIGPARAGSAAEARPPYPAAGRSPAPGSPPRPGTDSPRPRTEPHHAAPARGESAPADPPADPVAALLALPAPPPDATAAYGDRPDQVIDLWAPRAAERPAPLAVLLHGGAWRAAYDRAHLAPFAGALATQGFAVASVEYRRGRGEPDTGAAGRWPETLDDVAAAIDAVPALAARTLGGAVVDPGRFVLAGHSAGGHLALWAAARHLLPPDCAWRRPSPTGLRGVLAIAPIADFTTALELRVCGDAVRQLLGGDLSPTRLALTDPARLVPSGVPTTVLHGTSDAVVPPAVSAAFGTATAAAGRPVRLRMVPGAGHFEPVTPGTEASGAALAALHRLVRAD